MEFKEGDLVWAKMKGYSSWPGLISDSKLLKNQAKPLGAHCVYFFGSRNFGWVEDQNIKPYYKFKEKFSNANKSASFQAAVQEIEAFVAHREIDPNCKPNVLCKAEDMFNKLKETVDVTTDKHSKRQINKELKVNKSASKKPRLDNEDNYMEFENELKKCFDQFIKKGRETKRPDTPTETKFRSEFLRNENSETSHLTFGFIGLGIMGSGIVKNIIKTGHKVNLWSRHLKKAEEIKMQLESKETEQVEVYPTPCDVVKNSDVIFCCVSDPLASKDIVFGRDGVIHQSDNSLEGKGYVEMTSVDPQTSKDICSVITSKGGRYLEAQIQGSNKDAHEGKVIILGAGDKTLFNDCVSCFKAIGKMAFYLEEVGNATKMNLILQTINGVALAGLVEGFALADRCGLFPKDVLEIFALTNISSSILMDKATTIVESDISNLQMPVQHMQKDLKLAHDLADTLQQPLLMTSTAKEVFKHLHCNLPES